MWLACFVALVVCFLVVLQDHVQRAVNIYIYIYIYIYNVHMYNAIHYVLIVSLLCFRYAAGVVLQDHVQYQ